MNDALQRLVVPPGWPASVQVRVTPRGRADTLYGSFNLGLHVGDSAEAVNANRKKLRVAGVPELSWLDQVHGCDVARIDQPLTKPAKADAAFTLRSGVGLAVMIADCLPVAVTNLAGTELAVVHCGWRGLAAGVLDATLEHFNSDVLLAAFGPAIGPCHYEVGREVATHFSELPGAVSERSGRLFVDLVAIARASFGARSVTCGPRAACTHCSSNFYSYRRDGVTGRQALIAWLER